MKNALKNDDFSRELDELRKKVDELERINQEQLAEIKILEKENLLYELSFDCDSGGFWDLSLETFECYVSKSWNKMFGYSLKKKFSKLEDWKNVIHPDDFGYLLRTFIEYRSGTSSTYEVKYRIKHNDGSYRKVLSKGSIFYNVQGEPLRIAGSAKDITHKNEDESETIKNERRYKNLFENSIVGMFRINMDNTWVLEANKKALHMLKRDLVKFPFPFDFFYDPVDKEHIQDTLSQHGLIENYEMQLKRMDGTLFWVTFSACKYERENYIECVLKDINETKQNLMELQKVNFELDNFVYHASHDLRSPLRSVLGLVDLLRLEKENQEKETIIDLIESSIKRLDLLVKDLLSISRNNRVNDPFENINFMVEVNSCLSSVYHVQDIKNFEVVTKIVQPVPFYSDLTRIRIIFNNILSNAIKYRSFSRSHSFVNIKIEVTPKEAIIVITDNGEGIPEDKKDSVFDMFVRASESSEGSGLGLYIVKNALDKLNGSIYLESTFNVGTTFRIIIPNGTKEDRLK